MQAQVSSSFKLEKTAFTKKLVSAYFNIFEYTVVVCEFPKSDDIHDLGFFHVGLDPKGPKNI